MRTLLSRLICVAVFFYTTAVQAQDSGKLSFVHIDNEKGLSQSNVKSILQDSYGFMWFGTKNGLNRYDGQRLQQIPCIDEPSGRSDNNISALFEDATHKIWVGTDGGVFIYDPMREETSFFGCATPEGRVIDSWISTILYDKQGNIWISDTSLGMLL